MQSKKREKGAKRERACVCVCVREREREQREVREGASLKCFWLFCVKLIFMSSRSSFSSSHWHQNGLMINCLSTVGNKMNLEYFFYFLVCVRRNKEWHNNRLIIITVNFNFTSMKSNIDFAIIIFANKLNCFQFVDY